MKKNLLKNSAVQTLVASLLCIVLGLFLGYLVLLLINPDGAGDAILTVIKNFWTYNRKASQIKYLGNTLVKTAPLLMCALSILFSYKVGLFNIGAAGQYCVGAALSLYAALGLGWSWLPCMLAAILGGALLAGISGLLKSYCNVNEVISGIMLNWIVLYLTNMLLTTVKEDASPYTKVLAHINESAVLPSLGLGALFNNNQYVGLAIPLSVLMAILVWVVLEKTKFGYELKATGYNKNAAKYCGMAEKRNIIMTLAISLIVTILTMYQGFMTTDPEKLRLMRSLGARRSQMLWLLVFPANCPTLFNTLKVNVGLSWVGVIMGEFLVSRAGLGYLIVYGSQVFNMDLVMTSVLILALAAVVMYQLVLRVEKILNRTWGVQS